MGLIFLTLTAQLLAFIFYTWFKIRLHYDQVRNQGLPVLMTPFDPLNPIWALFQQYFAPIFYFLSNHLPPPLSNAFDFIHFSTRDWNFNARYTSRSLPFKYYGSAFFIVSPGETQLIISDPDAADNILSRVRKDFVKSNAMYGALEIFGPNVDTVNGDDWARHRRITAPPFNERNSSLVWRESLRQSSDMLRSWTANAASAVENTANETMSLALNVLTSAGFGKTYQFTSRIQEAQTGYKMSYREALKTILSHLVGAIITSGIPSFLIPPAYQRIKTAVVEFKKHMIDMVEEERTKIKIQGEENDNLMSVLLRSAQSEAEGNARTALNDAEILGNLFIYNLAGHDTTANTLAYAIILLSTEPKLQDWIREELDAVFGAGDQVENWQYEDNFPKLKRCLALMVSSHPPPSPLAISFLNKDPKV